MNQSFPNRDGRISNMSALVEFSTLYLDADSAPKRRSHLERTGIERARDAVRRSLSMFSVPIVPRTLITFGYVSARRRCLAAGLPEEQLTRGDCGAAALALAAMLNHAGISHELWVSCEWEAAQTSGFPDIGHVAIRHADRLYDWSGQIDDDKIFIDGSHHNRLVKLDRVDYRKTWRWFRKSTGWMISPAAYLRAMADDLEIFAEMEAARAKTLEPEAELTPES